MTEYLFSERPELCIEWNLYDVSMAQHMKIKFRYVV